jgi:hypothetical protein
VLLAGALFVASALADDGSAADDQAAGQTVSRSEPDREVARAEQPVTQPETDAIPAANVEQVTTPKHQPMTKPGKAKKDKAEHRGKPGKGKPGKGGKGKGGKGKGGKGKR